jgi:metal-responsive CopG/Arc/MetJ family transcriptional regulator
MKTNISVTLDKGLINQLEELAKSEDRSLSSILRIAGRDYLRRFNKPQTSFSIAKKTRRAA